MGEYRWYHLNEILQGLSTLKSKKSLSLLIFLEERCIESTSNRTKLKNYIHNIMIILKNIKIEYRKSQLQIYGLL